MMTQTKQNHPYWKRNLIILCIGHFFSNAGLTMIVPFIALYLSESMGITNTNHIAGWAGAIVAANFVTSFVFQPFWGRMADRYGRKLILLRSGFGIALVIACMGFATQAWHLLVLRLLNGVVSGFNPSAAALISSNSPQEKTGTAMGITQSAVMSGMVFGPLIGGWMTTFMSYQDVFFWTGGAIFVSNLLIVMFVKETFRKPTNKIEAKGNPVPANLKQIPQLRTVFFSTLLLQFAVVGMTPLIPIYISELRVPAGELALWAGIVSAAAGVSNMVLAPLLGKWVDRYGARWILFGSLLVSILTIFPQAFVTNVEQLAWARLVMGIGIGGLFPCLNTLIRQYAPPESMSRAYGINGSYNSLGSMAGAVLSGFLASWIGVQGVIGMAGVLLCVNAYWIYRYFIHSEFLRKATDLHD